MGSNKFYIVCNAEKPLLQKKKKHVLNIKVLKNTLKI